MKSSVSLAVLTAALLLGGCSAGPIPQFTLKDTFGQTASTRGSYAHGKSLLAEGNPAQAIEAFRKDLSKQGPRVGTLNALAISYSQLGRPDVAERYFLEAFELDRSAPETAYNYSRLKLMQGKFEEARQFADLATVLAQGKSPFRARYRDAVAEAAPRVSESASESLSRVVTPSVADTRLERSGVKLWDLTLSEHTAKERSLEIASVPTAATPSLAPPGPQASVGQLEAPAPNSSAPTELPASESVRAQVALSHSINSRDVVVSSTDSPVVAEKAPVVTRERVDAQTPARVAPRFDLVRAVIEVFGSREESPAAERSLEIASVPTAAIPSLAAPGPQASVGQLEPPTPNSAAPTELPASESEHAQVALSHPINSRDVVVPYTDSPVIAEKAPVVTRERADAQTPARAAPRFDLVRAVIGVFGSREEPPAASTSDALNEARLMPTPSVEAASPAVASNAPAKVDNPATLRIVNAAGKSHMAQRFGEFLDGDSYTVNGLANAESYCQEMSVIRYRPGFRDAAIALTHRLPAGFMLIEDKRAPSDIELQLGRNLLDFDQTLYTT